MTKTQTIAASDARNNFSDLISQVQYKGEIFLIERYGEVVAKIVPAETQAATGIQTEKEEKEREEKIGHLLTQDDEAKAPPSYQAQQSSKDVLEPQQSAKNTSVNELEEFRARYQRMTAVRRSASPSSYLQRASVLRTPQDNSNPYKAQVSTQSAQDFGSFGSRPSISIRDSKQDEETQTQSDSGWSALKKLEELIAAQKAKTAQSEEAKKAESSVQFGQDSLDQADQDSTDQPEIIRKKIEL